MVFAQVTRSTFTIVGLFDHAVFKDTTPYAPLTSERERLWEIFEERTARGVPPGALFMFPPIANNGHSVWMRALAAKCARTVYAVDPKLDDQSYVKNLYEQVGGGSVPARPQLRWCMHYLDLGLIDKAGTGAFGLIKGPN